MRALVRRAFPLLLALVPAVAQSLELGLYGGRRPTLTLELRSPEGWFRLQQGALGLGWAGAVEFGPLGRLGYGLGMGLGAAGWGVEGRAAGSLGPWAASLEGRYSTVPGAHLWVGETREDGLGLRLSGRYRLDAQRTLGLLLGFQSPQAGPAHGGGELSYSLRQAQTHTLGLGVEDSRVYALWGWRGELDEAGTLLEVALRAGQHNRLDASLAAPLDEALNLLKLGLTLAYPLAFSLRVEAYGLRANVAYDGEFSLWLRYTVSLGGGE
ncbi:hypothetical protein DV704_08150 [Meiothermus sp. QL-1]|uniref:hypothetical protein n=1 Tax=Meiothermus sp. QL-1 TaxID=2058095 RepID=UPI000E0B9604|nr:hypothetical protein [Meiothermus sp. QL-1]RDI95270.1 hypothetical protein DV704_08150 [Meiothermus sp. QL-1]